jgi:hypothetical protein
MILICILAASAGFVFGWAMGSRMARANQEGDYNDGKAGKNKL